MTDKAIQIAHDIPSFDEGMRKLIQVPKGAVEGKRKTKDKKRKGG